MMQTRSHSRCRTPNANESSANKLKKTDRERHGLQYKRITVKIGLKTNSNDPLNKMDSKMKCEKIQNVTERDGEREKEKRGSRM